MGTISGDELARWERSSESGGSVVGVPAGGGTKEERILVSVRLRPLNEKEITNRDPCDWECINETTVIFKNSLPERSMFPTAYTFDRVFRSDSPTKQVYEEGAKEVALSVVSGINSSIFAYGQTSSGKTYTMSGITEYSVSDIYDYIQKHPERAFVLKFSAMEIYNEAVRDLLSPDNTPLRLLDDPERGTIVEKLTEETLRDWDHLQELLSICEAQRQIGETSLNETSSRSHQILRLTIESSARDSSSTLAASVNFVDLAGSERASQAMSVGARLKEGCHINRSLLTLGTVIRKLSKGRNGHIPYRDSKLTRILQHSLGGNARTAIICTMSPARSHIEQSRNTLLFAYCAKEVVTNAQVNVVMSDKALVKHLQKELARLESELKCPGSNATHAEVLLREKDVQIRKMEKEIKELLQQRDLAQSRLEDLLRTVKDDQASSQLEFPQFPKDDDLLSEASSISFQTLSFGAKRAGTTQHFSNEGGVSKGPNMTYLEKPNSQDGFATQLSISSPTFMGLLPDQDDGEDITLDNTEEFEDLCKEVRCIEMDESSMSRGGALFVAEGDNLLCLSESSGNCEQNLVPSVKEDKDSSDHVTKSTVCTLEQQLENMKRASAYPPNPSHDELSPWPSARDFYSSRSSVLARSRSCRATLMHSCPPSPWFLEDEQNENTPPSMSVKDFPGRPEGLRRRALTLNYTAQNDVLSGEGSESSESTVSADVLGSKKTKCNSEEDITTISDFVAGMKEMAQIQYQKQRAFSQNAEGKFNEELMVEKSMKDVGVDPMLNPMESPSRRTFEFEKQQQEIIDLWHECNVSLVHRTYFFLLFKGDPADSIYMEVESRRLSYLKRTFAGGDVHKPIVGDSHIATPASSARALRRERETLCRQMQKRLSKEERESLYRKWGIALDSKQRRVQLSRLLWSNPKDMEHVRESASVVAKLIGLLESGLALKEMLGLSFRPQQTNHRSYSWKYGVPSLM